MSRLCSLACNSVLLLMFFVTSAHADIFPNFHLDAEFTPEEAQSIGVSPKVTTFSPYDVQKDFLLVEIFSMYCPHCQRQAPIMNDFLEMLKKSSYADKFGIVGIGVGNSPFEVDIFRNEYKINFPLIPDEDFTAHTATGEHGTPHFFLIDMRKGKNRGTVLHEHAGVFADPKAFLNEIESQSGL